MARRLVFPDASAFARVLRLLGAVSIALGLSAGGASAVAATTTTTPPPSTTPTTVALLPPPPPFAPGDDFGRLLKVRRTEANTALQLANSDIATDSRLVALRSDHVKVASHMLSQAHEHARATARQLVFIHEQIKVMAVDAYMIGSSPQITGAFASFTSAKDVVGLARNLTLVRSSHLRLFDLVKLEQREQKRAAVEIDDAILARAAAVSDWRAATSSLADAQQRKASAISELDQVARDQVRFFDVATTSASPIMGPSRLTADDLVAYIDSLHLDPVPHLTVPMRTLAAWYISEGNAEGIRGDVAFAQSILETGAFTYPGHGLVDPTDNNYAGIDACDSCKHGDRFVSALIGVRAQMQLLRVYADPTLKKVTDFANPLALLHEPHLGFSGHVKTWYALGGRWATGPNYGFHIYDIYMEMVALSLRNATR